MLTVTRLAAMKKADYYSILGLEPTATPEEVKRAYRERAKSTHPDASRTADTISEFMKVKEAYETLYDAQRRSEFDRKRKVRGLGVGLGLLIGWGFLGRVSRSGLLGRVSRCGGSVNASTFTLTLISSNPILSSNRPACNQIAEVTELAACVGEILATDLAIPLARDVALPLIKASIQALDKTVIQQFATPFLQKTIADARAAMDTLRQASEDRVTYFNALQAAWRAEEIKQLSAQLEEATRKAKLAQDQALAAAELLTLAADAEQLSRAKLEEELRTGEEIATRTAALQAASATALSWFQKKMAAEDQAKTRVRRLKGERQRTYVAGKSARTAFEASQAELNEAEEVLRRAQLRAEKVRTAHALAMAAVDEAERAAATVSEQLAAENEALAAAAAEVVPERAAWEGMLVEEKELQSAYFRHVKAERALKLEVGGAVRRKEATARELDKAKGETARWQEQVMELAAAIEKKYQEAQSGSGIGASSSAGGAKDAAAASKAAAATARAQQKESFEAVMGAQQQTSKANAKAAAAAAAASTTVFAAAEAGEVDADAGADNEAAARRRMKEEWVKQQQEMLQEDLLRASEAAVAASAAAREESSLQNVLSGMGI